MIFRHFNVALVNENLVIVHVLYSFFLATHHMEICLVRPGLFFLLSCVIFQLCLTSIMAIVEEP